jgi:hypothetical protein
MLQVQEAVKRSLTTFVELFSDADLKDLRLEEVSLSPDDANWLVTVSYKNPDYGAEPEPNPSETTGLAALLGGHRLVSRRLQKTIKLRAENGDFVGIKTEWEN